MIDEMTKPPTQETEGDITVSLSRAQAVALLKASEYVWGRSAASLPLVPAWVALAEGITALRASINDAPRREA